MGARRSRLGSRSLTRVGTVAALLLALLVVSPRADAQESSSYDIDAPTQSELHIDVRYSSGRRSPARNDNPYAACTFDLFGRDEVNDVLVGAQRWGGEFTTIGAYDADRFVPNDRWWVGVCPVDSWTRFTGGSRATVWAPGQTVPVDTSQLAEHAAAAVTVGPTTIRTAPSGSDDRPFLTNLPVGFTFIPTPDQTVTGSASAGPLTITATGSLRATVIDADTAFTRCDWPLPTMDELVYDDVPDCSIRFDEPGEVDVTAEIVYDLTYTCSTGCDLSTAPLQLIASANASGVVREAIGLVVAG